MALKAPWPIYPKGSKAQAWQRSGALLGAVALVYTVYAVVKAPPCEFPVRLLMLAALWGLVPPLWWWFEFFFIFPHHHTTEKFELIKHGAQASLAIWAPIAVALAAFSASDYFKKPEAGKPCAYARSTSGASLVPAQPPSTEGTAASGKAEAAKP
jgi:hypothetical protein